jgi:hypothetical protein
MEALTKQNSSKPITNTFDLADTLARVLQDLQAERILPALGNAISNAAGKLIKCNEMQIRNVGVGKALPLAFQKRIADKD